MILGRVKMEITIWVQQCHRLYQLMSDIFESKNRNLGQVHTLKVVSIGWSGKAHAGNSEGGDERVNKSHGGRLELEYVVLVECF
jgi:hypothetical protein